MSPVRTCVARVAFAVVGSGVFGWGACNPSTADAQGAVPPAISGTNRALKGPTTITPYGVGPRVHSDYGGHACISVTATAEAEQGNSSVYQHFLHVTNRCGASIKIRACYRNSSRGISERIFGYQKHDYILGIATNEKTFDYDYRELFP